MVFCELNPPADPPLLFYRLPIAPDLTLSEDDVPWDVMREVPLLWVTGTGVSAEPARATQRMMLANRGRRTGTPCWTWTTGRCSGRTWRPRGPRSAGCSTTSRSPWATGPRCEIAVGTSDPDEAADRLLARGISLALVKKGAEGVLVATPEGRWTVEPNPVEVVCGLGAGDAFGGSLVHGLLSGWDPVKIARYANAAGAIVASRLACADAMPDQKEIEELL